MSSTMVVVELALTILLLVGAGLMIRSFMSLYRLDIGIATDRLMAMRLQLPQSKYPEPQDRQAFYDRLEPRLIAIAGVDAIAVTTTVPPFGTGRRPFEIEGRPARQGDDESLAAYWVTVSPRFFDVVRAPVSRGRVFNAVDGSPGNETVIISQRMAAQFFPGEDPLGRRIRFTQADPASGRLQVWCTIVGVAPQNLVQLAAGAAAARRRLRSTTAGAAWRRDVAREKPVAADIGHRCHSRRRAVGRSRSTRFHDSDARRDAGRVQMAISGIRQHFRDRGDRRPRVVRDWAIRRDGVFGDAANPGDWSAHGTRRRKPPGVVAHS